jgi:hypothetical protein
MLLENGSAHRPPRFNIGEMIWGMAMSQAVYVTAKLGIIDALCEGPKTARVIAHAVRAHEPSLRRLLQMLTTIDILNEEADGTFRPTATGELLASGHARSSRAMAILMASPFVWQAWGRLEEAVMTGKPAFDQHFGESFFEFLDGRPEEAMIFHAAMTGSSSGDSTSVLEAYDFSGCRRIVDVGGGKGALLQAILNRYPRASGVLCDLPAVAAAAQAQMDLAVAHRCEFVGADMFQEVPAGGDVYILRNILHDWNDAQVLQLLQNCRRAMAADGKLLHIGLVLGPPNAPDFGRLLDLTMLALLPGRERSEAELQALYAAAGFRLNRVIPLSGSTIVEGVAV